MPESSRDMQMPRYRYSRCRDIVGSEYRPRGTRDKEDG